MHPRMTNEQVFVENSSYPRHRLKERILKQKLIPYVCTQCSNTGEWQNRCLVLQLEHKNGKNDDHRIENLEFLCPNCHSQTETYSAKNRKNPNRSPKSYQDKHGVLRNLSDSKISLIECCAKNRAA